LFPKHFGYQSRPIFLKLLYGYKENLEEEKSGQMTGGGKNS
jgi:hypothetical protein